MSQEDLNGILDVALSMGCDGLEKEGLFYPYAVTLEPSGSFQRSGELTDEEKASDPEETTEKSTQHSRRRMPSENAYCSGSGRRCQSQASSGRHYGKSSGSHYRA